LTIVTPCLNAKATIERTFESIAGQRYERVEHIVVDGGSTDGTLDLLEAWSDEGRIRLVSESDNGLSDALNKGFRLATGDLIASLNADDYYFPGAFERVAAAYRDRPDAPWITGRCVIVGAHDQEIRRPVSAYKNFLLQRYSYWLLLTQCFVSTPATFFTRRALEEVGLGDEAGLFDESLRYAADYDLFLRLGRLGPPAIVLGHPMSAFRMAGETLSLSGFEEQFAEGRVVARRYGAGHPFALAAHIVLSDAIVLTYRTLRWLRTRRGARFTCAASP
jgi:glycosyltransferase involved in cell wall biosynthesis